MLDTKIYEVTCQMFVCWWVAFISRFLLH